MALPQPLRRVEPATALGSIWALFVISMWVLAVAAATCAAVRGTIDDPATPAASLARSQRPRIADWRAPAGHPGIRCWIEPAPNYARLPSQPIRAPGSLSALAKIRRR